MVASITLFANNTSPTGPQLDNNFLAYAVFCNIPCTVSGTNALTLTQNANTPTLTQLTNYIQFTGVFTSTNTGAVTITAGAFSVLNAYKDSPAGPIPFSGGECVIGCAFSARYDSALNSGNGGYHLTTGTGFSGGTVSGSLANITLSGGTLAAIGGSIGASLTSSLLSGNSLTVSALLNTGTSLQVSIASVTSLSVGASASPLLRMISGLGTLTYSVTPANSTQDQTFAVAGGQIRDSVALGLGTSTPAGVGFTGFFAANGTVTVRMINPTAASIAAATLTVRATALGFT